MCIVWFCLCVCVCVGFLFICLFACMGLWFLACMHVEVFISLPLCRKSDKPLSSSTFALCRSSQQLCFLSSARLQGNSALHFTCGKCVFFCVCVCVNRMDEMYVYLLSISIVFKAMPWSDLEWFIDALWVYFVLPIWGSPRARGERNKTYLVSPGTIWRVRWDNFVCPQKISAFPPETDWYAPRK